MNAKQRATLERLFQVPILANIRWDDVESLFKAVGEVQPRGGSMVYVKIGTIGALFHRPHPRPELSRPLERFSQRLMASGSPGSGSGGPSIPVKTALVRAVRDFLTNVGVTP